MSIWKVHSARVFTFREFWSEDDDLLPLLNWNVADSVEISQNYVILVGDYNVELAASILHHHLSLDQFRAKMLDFLVFLGYDLLLYLYLFL